MAGWDAVRAEGEGAWDVEVVFLEGVVGGKGEEGAAEGLGEEPRSERPKILDDALPSEAGGVLGLELGLDW